jgi:hypothetical protein
METERDRAALTFETYPVSTDDLVWEDSELSEPEEISPVILDDVPAADALDQARTVPLDDDR